jgi:hypothetical protein
MPQDKKKPAFGLLDVLVIVVVLYAFVVAVYNTFVSDCELGGSDHFGRKLVTWLIAWPIMLLCRSKGVAEVGAAPTTSFSYSTEI